MIGILNKNWLITAWLDSPLCGEPPELDAILEWELTNRLKPQHAGTLDIWTQRKDIPQNLPLPVASKTFGRHKVYCCSSPILPKPQIPEWVDNCSKRFESSKMSVMISPEYRKSLLVASGPYKSRFIPERIRNVDCVCWFVRGNRYELNKLLKSIHSLGRRRNVGYGSVWKWEFEEQEDDYSIFAPCNGKTVLMRVLPADADLDNVCGYRKSFGGYKPPYFHPAFHTDIVVPC